MPIIGILSIGKISGIIVIIGSIINLITRNNIKVQINRITVLIIAFVFYATISIIWASDYSLYVFRLERILFSFILFIFTFLVISNQKSINYIIHHLWKVIGLLNLIVVVAYNTPFEIISNNFQSNGRLSGGMGDPNEFALFNIALLPFVLSRCLKQKEWIKKCVTLVFTYIIFNCNRSNTITCRTTGPSHYWNYFSDFSPKCKKTNSFDIIFWNDNGSFSYNYQFES